MSFPPYAYVPGGPWPHPISSPAGHSAGERLASVAPIVGDDPSSSALFLRGVDLFNAGYYWEAHEAWEALWHAHGRVGATATLLKGLILLAAAGVKVREGRPAGVATHAGRASRCLEAVRVEGRGVCLGLDLDRLRELARRVGQDPPTDQSTRGTAVAIIEGFMIRLAPPPEVPTP